MSGKLQSLSIGSTSTGQKDMVRRALPIEGDSSRPTDSPKLASWSRGLSLSPKEYGMVDSFARIISCAENTRLALSDPQSARRLSKSTKARPFPLDAEHAEYIENMALDLYRELREGERTKTAADRVIGHARKGK